MRNQQGFTLIELMVVIAIIAILSAIGIPAYQSYISKAALTDMLQTFNQHRNQIELCGLTQGGLENCNSGSHGIPLPFQTRYIGEMNISRGVVALAGREALQGLIVVLTPHWNAAEGTIHWTRQCQTSQHNKLLQSCEDVFRFDSHGEA